MICEITTRSGRSAVAPLFDGWQETLIWSALQGVMGRIWADDTARPTLAQVWNGDFCFLADDAARAEALALARNVPNGYQTPWMLYTPQSAAWAEIIKAAFPNAWTETERYAIQKEPYAFDKQRLQRFVQDLPDGFTLRRIDAALYRKLLANDWSRDFCSQFLSAEDYERRGLGYAVMEHGEPIGGASSYVVYDGGIEIEICVTEPYRRRGLAAACAARLILGCLDRGWYPSWDASSMRSVALAEKLGYHLAHPYTVYEIDRAKLG